MNSPTFDLGLDGLVARQDLAALNDPWRGTDAVSHAHRTEALPVLPNLSPWAAALEVPGLDSVHLGH
ncbi:MAG: hypothetical protein U0R64_09290 [Candidatus Nanopelagicales bacterium]